MKCAVISQFKNLIHALKTAHKIKTHKIKVTSHYLPHYTFSLVPEDKMFPTHTTFILSCVFFWVIPQRLNFMCRCFGTLCLFHLRRRLRRWNRQSVSKHWHIKFRCQGITQKKAYHGKSLKSRTFILLQHRMVPR